MSIKDELLKFLEENVDNKNMNNEEKESLIKFLSKYKTLLDEAFKNYQEDLK